MDQEEFEMVCVIKEYHEKVIQKMSDIKSKVNKKEGWLFVKHKYTQEELTKDEDFCMIESIINKLSSNVTEWSKQRKLYSQSFYSEYENNKTKIVNYLEELRSDIFNRKPTGWERIKSIVHIILSL
jgi:hypothetical protein